MSEAAAKWIDDDVEAEWALAPEEADFAPYEEPKTGIDAIMGSSLVSYERLPMLDVIFDRLVRVMTTSLRNFTSDNIEVGIESVESVRFGDHLADVPMPAMLAVFRAQEWDNYGLVTLHSDLIYAVVDVLLGGRRGSVDLRGEGRSFTTIETMLVERMVHVVMKDLSAAFEPLSPVNFAFERIETNPRFASIARPTNAAVNLRLSVNMEDRGGTMELTIPYATLEPVRELLLERFMGEKFGRDTIWESHLAHELHAAHMTVEAVLGERTMRLSDISRLRVGETITFGATAERPVELRASGVTLAVGQMGQSAGRVAVQLTDGQTGIEPASAPDQAVLPPASDIQSGDIQSGYTPSQDDYQ
ncbi:MAG: flagellar motor switch protein FliM [Pacificimonas sp.]